MSFVLPPKCPAEFRMPSDSHWQTCGSCHQWRRSPNKTLSQKVDSLCQSLGFACEKPEEAYRSDLKYLTGRTFPNGRKFINQKWIECDSCQKMRWVPDYLKEITGEGAFNCGDIHYSCSEPQIFPETTIDFLIGYYHSEHYIEQPTLQKRKNKKIKLEEASAKSLSATETKEISDEALARSLAFGFRARSSDDKKTPEQVVAKNETPKDEIIERPLKKQRQNQKTTFKKPNKSQRGLIAIKKKKILFKGEAINTQEVNPTERLFSVLFSPKEDSILHRFQPTIQAENDQISSPSLEDILKNCPTLSVLYSLSIQERSMHPKKRWVADAKFSTEANWLRDMPTFPSHFFTIDGEGF